jgi:adenylyltransferase/sulfurtransferase
MGSIQAVEAMKLMLGQGEPLQGRLLLFNATDMSFNELRFKKNEGCPVCGRNPTITSLIDYEAFCGLKRAVPNVREIAPLDLKHMMDSGETMTLLDVREPFEHQLCRIKGSKLIPLGELRGRAGELDRATEIVVYCHVGARSATATELLSSLGFVKVRNLKGGISAWSQDVDPTVPTY